MINDENIKDININNYDIKHPYKNKKKKYCPFCGNVMHGKLIDKFIFCDVCHERLPGIIMKTEDRPVKEIKL